MTTIQIALDPNDPTEIAEGQAVLARLLETVVQHPAPVLPAEQVPPAAALPEIDLSARLRASLAPPYGRNRRAFVRVVAENPYGASQEAAIEASRAANPDEIKDHARAIGGTHASIEACWKDGIAGSPWSGMILPQAWISFDERRRVHSMDPRVAAVTLEVLDQIEVEIEAGTLEDLA